MRKRGKHKPRSPLGGAALLFRRCVEQAKIASLSRPLRDDEAHMMLIPARVSADRLRAGAAELQDLHNVAAFINVGGVLASDIGEREACAAIQAGVFAICAVKDRGGPRYAMNAEQRDAILQAVSLTDEVFGVSTLLEIGTAHHKLMKALPMTGTLRVAQVDV